MNVQSQMLHDSAGTVMKLVWKMQCRRPYWHWRRASKDKWLKITLR